MSGQMKLCVESFLIEEADSLYFLGIDHAAHILCDISEIVLDFVKSNFGRFEVVLAGHWYQVVLLRRRKPLRKLFRAAGSND